MALVCLAFTGCHVIFGLDEFSRGAEVDGDARAPIEAGAITAGGDAAPAPEPTSDIADPDVPSDGGAPRPGVDASPSPTTERDAGAGGSPPLVVDPDAGQAGGPVAPIGGGAGASSGGAGGGGNSNPVPPDAGVGGSAEGGVAPNCDACTEDTPHCVEGECVECLPGAKDCQNDVPRECVDGVWTSLDACVGARCIAGECAAPSCVELDATCGPLGNEDCCTSLPVTGGPFLRQNDVRFPVTLSDYRLDRFEVTVGRFRKFLEARDGWVPAPDEGAYPRVPNSGWDASWTLPNRATIESGLGSCSQLSSWTSEPGANENLPINCVNWYEAFAFCAWDGGHLPTDTQLNYAAAGGAEQRFYPWSVPATSMVTDQSYAVTDCPLAQYTVECLVPVGSKPSGFGLFGHAEMTGNVREWAMDWDEFGRSDLDRYACGALGVNCLSLGSGSGRSQRGGAFGSVAGSTRRADITPATSHDGWAGVRCARPPLQSESDASCTPADRDCDGSTARICDLSGQWLELEACAHGCELGVCNDCTAPEVSCVDNVPVSCDATGRWLAGAPCDSAKPVCRAGVCAPRCSALATCGPAGDEDCCSALNVPGGDFERWNDPQFPARVSSFDLDRFEVSVGRFREFVDAYPASRPAPGDGAHPTLPNSGWDSSWDTELPDTRRALLDRIVAVDRIDCGNGTDVARVAFTAQPGANEQRAMNCVNWYEAFAFCAWSGGRLPTLAEHGFAAAGGAEQRFYPWSEPPSAQGIDASHANYARTNCPLATTDESACITFVGALPGGNGPWGHADLSGNVAEWVFDRGTLPLPVPCVDCAADDSAESSRLRRGGSWYDSAYQLAADRPAYSTPPSARSAFDGFRCVQP